VTCSLAVDVPAEESAAQSVQGPMALNKVFSNYQMLDTWGESSDDNPERLSDADIDSGVADELARMEKRGSNQGKWYLGKRSKNPWYLGKRAAN
jgi:hypothetical protein